MIVALTLSGSWGQAGDQRELAAERLPALIGAFSSLEDATEDFLQALARGDRQEIEARALNRAEFVTLIYPALPASRFTSNLSADFVWGQSVMRSRAGLTETLRHAGRRYELVELRVAGGVKEYPGFGLHQDVRLLVREESGSRQELKLFSSIIELDGKFKIYSFRQEGSRGEPVSASPGTKGANQ